MDVFHTYTYGSAAWLGVQALPLILMPKLIIGILAEEAHHATDLEVYFARTHGFTLITLALITLFLTGAIPLSSTISSSSTPSPPQSESVIESSTQSSSPSPYTTPILTITALSHITLAIHTYTRYTTTNQTGFLLGMTGYTFFACTGGWCLLFGASDSGRKSKRTGRDKRMAGYPFVNVNEYDKRKDRKMT